MEENFKQVRLQDRQDQKILEKKHNAKVSILTAVFFSIFFLCLYISNYCVIMVALEIKLPESQSGVVYCLLKVYMKR